MAVTTEWLDALEKAYYGGVDTVTNADGKTVKYSRKEMWGLICQLRQRLGLSPRRRTHAVISPNIGNN